MSAEAEIAQTERVSAVIRQTAGLCTFASVSASAADKRAEQALSRAADTERTVDKYLYLNARALAHGADITERQLAGGNYTRKTKLSEQPRSAGLVYRQLCARVQLHIRQSLVQQSAEPGIGNYQRINAALLKKCSIARRLLKLAVVEQCVERYIYANATFMTIFHRTAHRLVVEIVRVHTRVMHASAEIYRIRAALHRNMHYLLRAARNKQLRQR